MGSFYTDGSLIDFLDNVFGGGSVTGGTNNLNYNTVCPFCKEENKKLGKATIKEKLAIKIPEGFVKCWVCGEKGRNLLPILRRFYPHAVNEFRLRFYKEIDGSNFGDNKDTTIKPKEALKLPDDFHLLAEHIENPRPEIQEALRYLESRGATYRDLWYYKFGVAPSDENQQRRIIIPSFDEIGNLNYYTGRSYSHFYKKKYIDCDEGKESFFSKLNIVFNESKIDWSKELTITEGPFDLIKCDDNVTCILGSNFSQDSKLYSKIMYHGTPILLALDNDMEHKTNKLGRMFSYYNIPTRILNIPKQFKDVGEMSKKEFLSAKKKALLWSPEWSLLAKINSMF